MPIRYFVSTVKLLWSPELRLGSGARRLSDWLALERG